MNEIRIIQLQHRRIQIVMDDMLYCLMGHMEDVAEQIVERIEHLDEMLSEHKDLERRYLIPALKALDNRYLLEQSHQYTFELGTTLLEFHGFRQKWGSAEAIIERPLYFAIEAREMFKAIAECLWKKDYGLLPKIFEEEFATAVC
ncbi:MAG: hypothetical protein OCC49_12875 [Fibrobacterales bacterium]